ncbi:VOC family protein [Trujillonella endophytica]|uniref:VOC domain-containing protein n=1 Tax=Trujillonella endophytica TaxID=673521 RepID=A0A1H8T0E8_9ACTN|nr:VOC family protein [Trujillella endophytica]SEO84411.1 hypothetical protein SAMN05660991_01971 [Trujillella endophytica]
MTAAGPQVGSLAWIDLTTPDVDAAGSFYSRLLGWELESADTPMGRYVTGSVGAGPVGGMMAPAPGEDAAPPAWALFFGVADADRAVDAARRLGATVLQPPMEIPGGGRIAVVTDPAGAVAGLLEPGDGGSTVRGEPGAVAWVECQSRDVPASEAFYAELLGWHARPPSDGYRVLELGGEQVAGLMAMPDEVPSAVPGYWLPYFAVDDVDSACGRVEELGGGVLVPPRTVQDLRFAVAQDPAGAVFGLLRTPGQRAAFQ